MAQPTSRTTLIDYCLRRLGAPVLEINVDDEQLEDRLDDALQIYHEYHSEGAVRIYQPMTITADQISAFGINLSAAAETTGYADRILNVSRVFPIDDATSSVNFFDIKYQMRLNDMSDLVTGIGELAYYEQLQQYLSMVDMKLTGTPQIDFNRHAQVLYLHGELGQDLKEGDKILVELFISTSESLSKLYNDMFLKEYTTALIKKQWGENLIKFEGMQLPGGVTLNGRQIVDDANTEIEKLRERLYNEYDTPPHFFMG